MAHGENIAVTLNAYLERRVGPGTPWMMFLNSFRRSFTASSLRAFWRFWNPGFGYFLLTYFYAPMRKAFPRALALLLTFVACGLCHDLLWVPAVALRDGSLPFPFVTVWFAVIGASMGLIGGAGSRLGALPTSLRIVTHVSFLVSTFGVTWMLETRW